MELTCIVCPMGCRITVEKVDGRLHVSGNTCKRGEKYALQESVCPMRTLTTLVRVLGVVKGVCVDAPVKIGDVVVKNIAGTGVDLVATANRERR